MHGYKLNKYSIYQLFLLIQRNHIQNFWVIAKLILDLSPTTRVLQDDVRFNARFPPFVSSPLFYFFLPIFSNLFLLISFFVSQLLCDSLPSIFSPSSSWYYDSLPFYFQYQVSLHSFQLQQSFSPKQFSVSLHFNDLFKNKINEKLLAFKIISPAIYSPVIKRIHSSANKSLIGAIH